MRRWPAAVIVALLLALPAVHAERATSLEVRGVQEHQGTVLGVALRSADGGIDALSIEAATAYFIRWQQDGAFVSCPAGPCQQTSQTFPVNQEPERQPRDGPARDFQAHLNRTQAAHQINVVPLDGALPLRMDTAQARWTSHDDVCLTQAGLATPSDARPVCDGYDEAEGSYTNLALGRVQVYASTTGTLLLRGNMSLEMRGVALGGDEDFDARDVQDPGVAGPYGRVFGRLVLLDAVVEVRMAPGSDVQWAMQRGRAEAFDAVLTGQAERIEFGGRSIDLSAGESVRGDFIIESEAGPEGMPFVVMPPPATPAGSAPAAAGAWGGALALAALAVLAVPLALRLRTPGMPSVERALRAGRFHRAARLAARIVRRDPLHESAQLGHAIALTKGGRPQAAVQGVQAYLEQADPADGTLHYVLGLALLQLGRREEAQQALDAAVERTPALLAEVAPELRPAWNEAAYT